MLAEISKIYHTNDTAIETINKTGLNDKCRALLNEAIKNDYPYLDLSDYSVEELNNMLEALNQLKEEIGVRRKLQEERKITSRLVEFALIGKACVAYPGVFFGLNDEHQIFRIGATMDSLDLAFTVFPLARHIEKEISCRNV